MRESKSCTHINTHRSFTRLSRRYSATAARESLLTEHGRHWPDVVSSKRRWCNRLFLARFADRINRLLPNSAQRRCCHRRWLSGQHHRRDPRRRRYRTVRTAKMVNNRTKRPPPPVGPCRRAEVHRDDRSLSPRQGSRIVSFVHIVCQKRNSTPICCLWAMANCVRKWNRSPRN